MFFSRQQGRINTGPWAVFAHQRQRWPYVDHKAAAIAGCCWPQQVSSGTRTPGSQSSIPSLSFSHRGGAAESSSKCLRSAGALKRPSTAEQPEGCPAGFLPAGNNFGEGRHHAQAPAGTFSMRRSCWAGRSLPAQHRPPCRGTKGQQGRLGRDRQAFSRAGDGASRFGAALVEVEAASFWDRGWQLGPSGLTFQGSSDRRRAGHKGLAGACSSVVGRIRRQPAGHTRASHH